MLLKAIERLYGEPSITDLLYPFAYEDEQEVFLLMDGGFGLMWEIEGINVDGKSTEEMQKTSLSFANFLKGMPDETPMQLIVAKWRGIEKEDLANFESGTSDNSLIREHMARKVQWHERGKREGFFQRGRVNVYPSTIKAFFTVKVPNPNGTAGLYDDNALNKTFDQVSRIRTIVESSLASGNIKCRRTDPDSLIAFFYRMMNPARCVSVPQPIYQGGDMRRSFVFNSPEAQPEGWNFEDRHYSVLSFQNNPSLPGQDGYFYTFPNLLFRETTDGVSLYDYAPMFFFTMNFHFPSQESTSRSLGWKRAGAFLHRMNFLGDTAIDKEFARAETTNMLTAMYGGEKVAKVSYHLCIPTLPEETEYTTQELMAFLNITAGCNAFREEVIAAPIFMRSLPFGFDHTVPKEAFWVRRGITATASVIADVAPIYQPGQGKRTPQAAGSYNRHGQAIWFDPFNKETSATSPHGVITGATGAGKSNTAQDFILQIMRGGATVIVLDKRDSYQRPCLAYGGQYIKFQGDPEFILDPFVGNFDEDHRAFLAALVANMSTGGTETIARDEIGLISEAVVSAISAEERSIGDLVATLRNNRDDKSISVARKLFPFYGSGQYARFVEGGKPPLRLANKFTAVELGDLDMYPDLQSVVIFLLIYYITEYVKKIPGPKFLVIDEAHLLFKNQFAVDFLVSATKTFRALGCAVWFITQQLEDFAVIARAINMRDNCPNKILLYQEPDVIRKAVDILELSDGIYDLYTSVEKGAAYTEGLIVAQKWTGVFRNSLDPESYWLFTSSHEDKRYLDDLTQSGLTMKQAICKAAKDYPYGIGSAANPLAARARGAA